MQAMFKSMTTDIADTLKDLLRHELPGAVTIHASPDGVVLHPPRKRWAWGSGPACDIVFSNAMVDRLRLLAHGGAGMERQETLAYLEYVAAAIGFAYEGWQFRPEAAALHLDAGGGGKVQVTPWDDGRDRRRA